jgi:hypothetical protein
MSKKKVSPRAPFVVTVAMAGSSLLALVPACHSDIITNPPPPAACPESAPKVGDPCTDESGCTYSGSCAPTYSCSNGAWVEDPQQGTCNPPAPVCPETAPAAGSACDFPGESCPYPDNNGCGGTTTAYCGAIAGGSASGWQLSHDGPPCNPPACPEQLPLAGEACSIEAQVCDYQIDLGCGPQPAQVTCSSGAWDDMGSISTCNPPAPEYCAQYGDLASCQSDALCDWLVPGCGMPALPVAGCHPKTPCATSGDCVSGDTCQALVIDPCYMAGCDACGATVLVCMPPPPI